MNFITQSFRAKRLYIFIFLITLHFISNSQTQFKWQVIDNGYSPFEMIGGNISASVYSPGDTYVQLINYNATAVTFTLSAFCGNGQRVYTIPMAANSVSAYLTIMENLGEIHGEDIFLTATLLPPPPPPKPGPQPIYPIPINPIPGPLSNALSFDRGLYTITITNSTGHLPKKIKIKF
jgi:hypothetical protein